MNAVRMLTRLFAIAHSNTDSFSQKLFWENQLPGDPNLPAPELVAKVIEGKPLGKKIIDLLLRLLYVPNYTCAPFGKEDRDSGPDVPVRYAWAPGVCVSSVHPANSYAAYDSNRTDLVRCLLSLFSFSIFNKARKHPIPIFRKLIDRTSEPVPRILYNDWHPLLSQPACILD